jgi:hypothetical protein
VDAKTAETRHRPHHVECRPGCLELCAGRTSRHVLAWLGECVSTRRHSVGHGQSARTPTMQWTRGWSSLSASTWSIRRPPALCGLVTCYPFSYVGPAPKRFIVRATQDEAVASSRTLTHAHSGEPR